MNSNLSRRRLLTAAALMPLTATLSLAGTGPADSARFVFVVLRGGMDGLGAVPAIGDPAFAGARGPLATFAAPALPLDKLFALHPSLEQLHAMYGQGEMAVVHAFPALGQSLLQVNQADRGRVRAALPRPPRAAPVGGDAS